MKKEYQKPILSVVQLEYKQMLCQSVENVQTHGLDEDDLEMDDEKRNPWIAM